MKPCTVGGTQASEPSVACFQIHLCAVMQIYNDFGWELLFWQSVGCMLWCFPLTRQAACLKHGLVKILERADNDTVCVISVERSYLFFKWLQSSLLRILHGNCHSATFLSVATSAMTPDCFYHVEQSKLLYWQRNNLEGLRFCFFLTSFLGASYACWGFFWIVKDFRWLQLILEKLA